MKKEDLQILVEKQCKVIEIQEEIIENRNQVIKEQEGVIETMKELITLLEEQNRRYKLKEEIDNILPSGCLN